MVRHLCFPQPRLHCTVCLVAGSSGDPSCLRGQLTPGQESRVCVGTRERGCGDQGAGLWGHGALVLQDCWLCGDCSPSLLSSAAPCAPRKEGSWWRTSPASCRCPAARSPTWSKSGALGSCLAPVARTQRLDGREGAASPWLLLITQGNLFREVKR